MFPVSRLYNLKTFLLHILFKQVFKCSAKLIHIMIKLPLNGLVFWCYLGIKLFDIIFKCIIPLFQFFFSSRSLFFVLSRSVWNVTFAALLALAIFASSVVTSLSITAMAESDSCLNDCQFAIAFTFPVSLVAITAFWCPGWLLSYFYRHLSCLF